MDFFQRSINTYIQGGRAVMEDIRNIDFSLENPWRTFESLDWRVNTSIILLTFALGGFLTMFVLANLISPGTAVANKHNAALGLNSEAKRKAGSPPIPPPTEIVSLRIYPIKSCRGFEVSSTRLRKEGLTLDRNWMFISLADRKFLTIRSDPSMTLIDTSIVEDAETKEQQLEISIHGTDARVVIPAFPSKEWLEANTTLSTVEIWEHHTDAYEYPEATNAIFSTYFKKPVALVYKGPTARMVGVNGRAELYGRETPHHFADVMSLQVASEASLADLNRRLALKQNNDQHDLSMERFRPNIVVRGRPEHPWEEDTWKRIRLSTTLPAEQALYKIDLDVVARCARCQVPNVDPVTADKHAREPWDELMSFRRVDKGGPARWKPCFGMLCLPKNEGKASVGAKVEVLETTDRHLYNTARFEDL